ncbi:GNAT family N-acetyltransferase [Aminipila terrae]|uniref:GNAT family N-acetyltransferase n=1 Tax=Aminipila terrae TaxID=2697030 RepID=A0A6P1MFN4_9FIRM|nr:GNAT family N-acetyltransferase [Aminipila terrae]QHI73510.1 GNAT family N-acetyltransferase [Aminipila terrae]
MLIENPVRTPNLMNELTAVWLDSVKATHTFLSEDNIDELIPFVQTGLQTISKLIVAYELNRAVGFIGIEDDKIEMLFVQSDCIGIGVGKSLISEAIDKYNVQYVDVNEQNPNAAAFYQHFNFITFERTDFDEQGNPFPILKMRLEYKKEV